MIFVTGDTHGDFRRFSSDAFPDGRDLSRNDFVIILGDFGGVWDGGSRDVWWLDWLGEKPWTTLFVDGNHENYDILVQFPVEKFYGGATQVVRPNVRHLMRGEVFDLPTGHGDETIRILTMGGARSHDIEDGVIERGDLKAFKRERPWAYRFRINHESWWAKEMPGDDEYLRCRQSLIAANHKVDYIMTHCAPTSAAALLGFKEADPLTEFLESVALTTDFKKWFFGHYHRNVLLPGGKYQCLYEKIERIA